MFLQSVPSRWLRCVAIFAAQTPGAPELPRVGGPRCPCSPAARDPACPRLTSSLASSWSSLGVPPCKEGGFRVCFVGLGAISSWLRWTLFLFPPALFSVSLPAAAAPCHLQARVISFISESSLLSRENSCATLCSLVRFGLSSCKNVCAF